MVTGGTWTNCSAVIQQCGLESVLLEAGTKCTHVLVGSYVSYVILLMMAAAVSQNRVELLLIASMHMTRNEATSIAEIL